MDPMLPLRFTVLKLCQQALRRPEPRLTNTSSSSADFGPSVGRMDWMLPDLAKLIADAHDSSPHDFALALRRFMDEHTFVEDAGDPVFDAEVREETQALMNMAMRVHRAVHHHAEAHEHWHHIPVPPLMCG
ncbi:MAG: hypothetical protein AAGA25_08580 [Planctomycetota bacterium]